MDLFTSKRERRLWIWTAVVLIAIYSTLGLAGRLAEGLRNRALLDGTSFGLFILVLLATGAIALGRRASWQTLWVGLGVAAVYGMALIRIRIPEERTHLFEYTLVAVLIHQALLERRRHGRQVPAPALLALVATITVGWIDEGIQAVLPSRVYDLRDVGFNTIAALMGVGASAALSWAAERYGKR